MRTEAERPALLRAGLAVLVFGLYLGIAPFSNRSFDDAKLVALACGVFLIWLSRPPLDRRLLGLGMLWVGVGLLAAVLGVDAVQSLTGNHWYQSGLFVWAAAAYLLAVGARLPQDDADRVARWLVLAGLAVASLSIFSYFFGSAVGELIPGFRANTTTMGVHVTMIVVLVVSLAALLGSRDLDLLTSVIAAAIIGSAIAIAGQVSGLILPFVALAYSGWRGRAQPRRIAVLMATVALMLVAWPLLRGISAPDPTTAAVEDAPVVEQVQAGANMSLRANAWTGILRGFAARPVLGWGPANTWSAFLSEATHDEVGVAGRGFGDAHNMPIELLAGTGVLGMLAFLPLAIAVVPKALTARKEVGWASGAFVALGLFLMLEPVAIVTTALLFLTAGIAARRPPPEDEAEPAWARPVEVAAGVAMCLLLAFSLWNLTAETLHRQGNLRDSDSLVRTSLAMQPWRLETAVDHAFLLSKAAYNGDPSAAPLVREVMETQVRRHPWDPNVRIYAAMTEDWLGDQEAALAWMQQQFERFPGDIPFGEAEPLLPMPPGKGLPPATTP